MYRDGRWPPVTSARQDDPHALCAETLIRAMSEQIDRLRRSIEHLEDDIGRDLTDLPELPAQTIRSLQQLDRVRQSLQDVTRVLNHAWPLMQWKQGQSMSLDDLRSLVDMRHSLSELEQVPESQHGHQDDIWL